MPSDDERRDTKRSRHRDDEPEPRRDRKDDRYRDKEGRTKERSSERHTKTLVERRRSRESRRSKSAERKRSRSRSPGAASSRRRRSRDRDGDRRRDSDRKRRRSPEGQGHRRRRDEREDEEGSGRKGSPLRRGGPLPSQGDSFALTLPDAPKEKEKPNYKPTGILAAASNQVTQADGTVITLKYHEPPEARKPSSREDWKLFVFKGKDVVDQVDLNLRSCWLIGREAAVVDFRADHPSVSKQHCVIQFRYVEKMDEFGDRKGRVKPYLIDLESANGTVLNGERVEDRRYLELRSKDVIRLGDSTREYVVMVDKR